MLSKEECLKAIREFHAKNAVEASPENTITTIHLMNTNSLDLSAGLDQSSRNKGDNGIDGWHYDDKLKELSIYQSKLSESKALTNRGFDDLARSENWLSQVLIAGEVAKIPSDNNCLYNLFIRLSNVKDEIKRIKFILISLFDKNELEDEIEYTDLEKNLIKSKLNAYIFQKEGKLSTDIQRYNLEKTLPKNIKTYSLSKIPYSTVVLRHNAHLDLAYLSLYSLVELYKQRGDILFDKNVRLSLIDTKEAKERIVHPLEDTFEKIITNNLKPEIFPFYHLGITIAAPSRQKEESDEILSLESPSIINGCQTITIAHRYLCNLEKNNETEKIRKFKEIKVIAKVVVGPTIDELREITNANNRQTPIEDWQLFSNEPIHIEIESTLKDLGVFYERQKGKFNSLMKKTENAKNYSNTNGTFIKIEELGKIVCLCRKELQWAAKPSEIFINQDNHNKIFNKSLPKYPRDMIFCFNMHKSMQRALSNYLDKQIHDNNFTQKIYQKPIVKAFVFHVAMLYFYQRRDKSPIRKDYSYDLLKIASPKIVEEFESFYFNIVSKIKNWYLEQSKQLSEEVSSKSMNKFFDELSEELGIDYKSNVPFSNTSIDWNFYPNE